MAPGNGDDPTARLRRELDHTRTRYRRIITTIAAVCGLLVALEGIGIGFALIGLHNLVHESNAGACDFFRDLSGLPVTVPPGEKVPSRLGVSLISDSRKSWTTFNCPGSLGKPDPSLVKWAGYYNIPVN